MPLAEYFPILLQVALAIIIAVGIIVASEIFGQRQKRSKLSDMPYECGNIPLSGPHPRFSIKFYVTAMLFLLLDIEVVFLIPWALVYREFIAQNLSIILPGLFFLALLFLGLVYEIKKGALEWEK